jgi:hypothetical protein
VYNPRAVQQHLRIIDALAGFVGNPVNIDVTTPIFERQQSLN